MCSVWAPVLQVCWHTGQWQCCLSADHCRSALSDAVSVNQRLSDGKSWVFLMLVCPPTAGTVFHPQWRQPGTFSKPTVSRSSQNFYKLLSGWDFVVELYWNSIEFPVSSSEQAHSDSASVEQWHYLPLSFPVPDPLTLTSWLSLEKVLSER